MMSIAKETNWLSLDKGMKTLPILQILQKLFSPDFSP